MKTSNISALLNNPKLFLKRASSASAVKSQKDKSSDGPEALSLSCKKEALEQMELIKGNSDISSILDAQKKTGMAPEFLDLNMIFELLNLVDLKRVKSDSERISASATSSVGDIHEKRVAASIGEVGDSEDNFSESASDVTDSIDEEHEFINEEEDEDETKSADSKLEEDVVDDLNEYEEPLSDEDEEDIAEFDNPMTQKKKKRSVVDDDFFSLEEMERFAELSEARDIKMANKLAKKIANDVNESEEEDDDFSIGKDLATGEFDFDLNDDDGDNANDIRYEDFFESKTEKGKITRRNWKDDMETFTEPTILQNISKDLKIPEEKEVDDDGPSLEELFDDAADAPDEEENKEELSSFEKRQLRIQERIEKLEQENMAEKEWVMKGEASAKVRPVNSLLEQDLDVDIAAKPVPVITEETTKTIGELIIQRIKDSAFDDVVRKAPPKNTVYDPNRRWELDDEKSKKSLAEIYEEQYQKKVMNAEIKSERTIQVEKSHKEIADLMSNLFQNLDALSNFHYTPPPAEMELEIVPAASVPAISMEEIIPVHVSSASLATPAEVFSGKVAKTQAELEKNEKTNLRRKAKRKATQERKQRESVKKAKLDQQQGSHHQMSKQKAVHSLMGQKNVTIVVGAQKSLARSTKNATLAKTVREGGKIEETKPTFNPSMLKL